MQTIIAHRDILKELNHFSYNNHRLLMAEIDVTDVCNSKCFFCFQGNDHTEKPKLEYEQIVTLMDELKELGCLHLSLSGGEPFCRNDFLDLLRAAKSKGFLVSFATNLQIPNNDQIAELIQIGVDRVLVSFHSHLPSNYSTIFGVDEHLFFRAKNNLQMLLNSKTSVGLAVTVSEKNANELAEIKKMFMDMGGKEKDITFNMLLESAHNDNKIGLHRAGNTLKDYFTQNAELKVNTLNKPRLGDFSFVCSAGRSSCVIKSNGDILPCGFMNSIAGNIFETSLTNIWRDSHVFKMTRSIKENHFEKCISCSVLEYCPICIANNLNETGIYHTPSDEYCEFRKNIINSFN